MARLLGRMGSSDKWKIYILYPTHNGSPQRNGKRVLGRRFHVRSQSSRGSINHAATRRKGRGTRGSPASFPPPILKPFLPPLRSPPFPLIHSQNQTSVHCHRVLHVLRFPRLQRGLLTLDSSFIVEGSNEASFLVGI